MYWFVETDFRFSFLTVCKNGVTRKDIVLATVAYDHGQMHRRLSAMSRPR